VEQLVLKDLPDHKDQLGLLDQMVYKGQLDLPDLSDLPDLPDQEAQVVVQDLLDKTDLVLIKCILQTILDMQQHLLVLV
jgi:hypothetical protein